MSSNVENTGKKSSARADTPGGPPAPEIQSAESLRKLRSRVKMASRELRRLKKENAALATRIQELESSPGIDPRAAVLMFDEDPEQLRSTVKGFIRAIDNYLAEDAE